MLTSEEPLPSSRLNPRRFARRGPSIFNLLIEPPSIARPESPSLEARERWKVEYALDLEAVGRLRGARRNDEGRRENDETYIDGEELEDVDGSLRGKLVESERFG